jgi:hypothetical protein
MEADWEFEIGGDAPVIEADWTGFIDLRVHPERVAELIECRELPGLADVLVKLNAVNSPVWTSKTDVFIPEYVDPDEMNASEDEVAYTLACYIDLVRRAGQHWDDPAKAEQACRELCAGLQRKQMKCCRIDIVLRRAVASDTSVLGATVYVTACGPTVLEVKKRIEKCLIFFTELAVCSR